MKAELNENEVIVVDHINRDNYKHYIGKTVKVTGNVDLIDLNLTKLPITFTEVDGDFYCSWNQLSDLVGAPEKVGGDFYCCGNRLTSLEGGPNKVGKDFYCDNNELTSLEGAPKEVDGDLECSYNPLKSVEGVPEFIGGELYIDLM